MPSGSIVLSTRAPIGSIAITSIEACTNQGCKLLVANDIAVTGYYYYVLLAGREQLNLLGRGSTFLELSGDQLGAFRIPLPPLPEQQAIAAFLDRETAKIDGLIEEQRRLIALLAEKRQATISHAVTRGLNPSARLKPSGVDWLGDLPEGWEVVPLRRVCQILRGKFTHRPRNDPAFYDGEYPFIQTGDITSASRYIQHYKQTLNERGVSVSKQFPAGTLVMAIAANLGDVAILTFDAYFPDSIVGLVPEETMRVDYLYYLMIALKPALIKSATMSTQLNINADQIAAILALRPPVEEQDAIVEYLDDALSQLNALSETATSAIALLLERRGAVISAAVTGKIDVREAQASPVQVRKSLSVSVLLGGVIIAALGRHASMGRMLVQKHLFMAEAHAGVSELQGRYDRQAAGPFDSGLQRRVEDDLVAAGLLRVAQDGGRGSRVEYEFLGDAASLRADLAVALGDRMARFDDTFRQLADLSKPGIEAVATLYAAWNDFLMDGKNPSRDDIIREVLENWHPEKREKFTKADLENWLGWMDRHEILPSGTGPKTQTGRLFP